MPDKQRAIYRGDGSRYLNGVPARNLSEEDYQSLTEEQKTEVQESPLYEFRSDSEMSSSTAGRVVSKQPAAVTGTPTADADTKPAGDSA